MRDRWVERVVSGGETVYSEHRDLSLRVEQNVGHRDALVVPDVHVPPWRSIRFPPRRSIRPLSGVSRSTS
jgi:hypothetical protein